MAFIEREIGIAVAATAAALSPRAREVARQGAVYGLAGVLKAGDTIYGAARGAAEGAQSGFGGDAKSGADGKSSGDGRRRQSGGSRSQSRSSSS